MRTLFDRARDADYEDLVESARDVAKQLRPNPTSESTADHRSQVARLRKRLAEIAAIDFFGAIGRETAEGLLKSLEARLGEDEAVKDKATADYEGKRHGRAAQPNLGHAPRRLRRPDRQRLADPSLHRSGSPLQIRRRQGLSRRGDGELRFDMFEAEFTHEGDNARSRCCWSVAR